MTPLAYSIVKENWLPKKRRQFRDNHKLLSGMSDIHCFDVSEVFELADGLAEKWYSDSIEDGKFTRCTVDKTFAFLPAPKTWIEWTSDLNGGRIGFFLEELGDSSGRAVVTVSVSDQRHFGSVDQFPFALQDYPEFDIRINPNASLSASQQIQLQFKLYAFLALINSPKIIGRKQHMPHRALERSATKGLAGSKFPLHAWTEIKLQVSKPIEIDDGQSHEAHLTGQRALHFCRAHVRIRLGRLEYVSAHWRGDPSIGIKQSRYTVAP